MAHSISKIQKSSKKINRKYKDVFGALRLIDTPYHRYTRGRYSENFNRLDGIVIVLGLTGVIMGVIGVL